MAFSRTQAYRDGWFSSCRKIMGYIAKNPHASAHDVMAYINTIERSAEGDEMYQAADGDPPIHEHREIMREITGHVDG